MTQMAELGQILMNFTNIVPDGMVVFLPSYGFLHAAMGKWKASGVLDKLNAKKKVKKPLAYVTVLSYGVHIGLLRTTREHPGRRCPARLCGCDPYSGQPIIVLYYEPC